MPTKQGLTDLERGKYLPGGDNVSSTVRVQHDGKIAVSTVDLVTNIENLESVDLIDELAHVTNIDSLDLVSEIAHVTNVDLIDVVDNINSIDEVTHVTNLDLVDEVTHVTTVQTVQAVTQITNPVMNADYSVVPHETYNHFLRYLLNGASADQNVNGTLAVPVDFTTTATTRSLIHSFDMVIVARNMGSVLDYGTLSGGLTNGIQIIRKVGAVETIFFTITRMVQFAHPSTSGAFQTIALKANATEDLIIVSVILKDPILMQTGNSLIIRIRDNLTEATSGIAYQRATVLLKEV